MNKNSIEFKLIQSRLRETIEYSNYTLHFSFDLKRLYDRGQIAEFKAVFHALHCIEYIFR